MGFVVGAWVSPLAAGAVAFGVMLGLRAQWWAALLVVAACAVLATAGALLLGAWCERRSAMATAHWPQQQLRAEVLKPVTPRRRVTVNIINPADAQMAAVIRSITGGTDGTVQQQQELVEHRTHRQLRLPPQPRLTGDHRPPREAGQEGGGGEGSA